MSNFVTALINLGYFLLFHMFQTHVSKREKSTFRKFLHRFLDITSIFTPPPLLFRIVFFTFA